MNNGIERFQNSREHYDFDVTPIAYFLNVLIKSNFKFQHKLNLIYINGMRLQIFLIKF